MLKIYERKEQELRDKIAKIFQFDLPHNYITDIKFSINFIVIITLKPEVQILRFNWLRELDKIVEVSSIDNNGYYIIHADYKRALASDNI